MRIGTWNLAGRWTPAHEAFLAVLDCDVLLLTEVSERLEMPGYSQHRGQSVMAARRRWAAVLSRSDLVGLRDPHPASAMAVTAGLAFCSSVLPWKGSGGAPPWMGDDHQGRTQHTLGELLERLPLTHLVWGGDWNHALHGRENAGSKRGRTHLQKALTELRLDVPTEHLPHRTGGHLSIDHVAVPAGTAVTGAERVSALLDEGQLSDHDAYVVELSG